MTYNVTQRLDWRHWVTPKSLRLKPIHRWYVFPHSFTDGLVHALIDEWRLAVSDRILDPFVGAGTTLLAAQERGISATGHDLSPLAVFVTNTKVTTYCHQQLAEDWEGLRSSLESSDLMSAIDVEYPALVHDALAGKRLAVFHSISRQIATGNWTEQSRKLFLLALISLIPRFSHAVASGGWLKWLNRGAAPTRILAAFIERVGQMLWDVETSMSCKRSECRAVVGDVRALAEPEERYTAVITSPPYPNRHDYTRVFGIELMFAFLSWEENRALRYQSFHSHPEARPVRPSLDGYVVPIQLERCVNAVEDDRIRRMLSGYGMDIYLCLLEIRRVCAKGARVALVVGNAQYNGNAFLVDEIAASLGETAGLACREIRAVRWRGNSAQQMGRFGRRASRESVVIFEKP